ncbi:MAG: Transcriptional regulator of nonfermentable carbon utilization [Candelina submexicana]|nr:MAG: Transcriptional regulator of nonfermentable carbon utilization [Candelina submexicana]
MPWMLFFLSRPPGAQLPMRENAPSSTAQLPLRHILLLYRIVVLVGSFGLQIAGTIGFVAGITNGIIIITVGSTSVHIFTTAANVTVSHTVPRVRVISVVVVELLLIILFWVSVLLGWQTAKEDGAIFWDSVVQWLPTTLSVGVQVLKFWEPKVKAIKLRDRRPGTEESNADTAPMPQAIPSPESYNFDNLGHIALSLSCALIVQQQSCAPPGLGEASEIMTPKDLQVETGQLVAATNAKDSLRPKRNKARRACAACQRVHLTCGDERPCQRCIKRGIQGACRDGATQKDKCSSPIQNGGMQFAPQSSNSPNLHSRTDQQTAQIQSSSTLMPHVGPLFDYSFSNHWDPYLLSHISSGVADTPPGENGNSNSMFQNQVNMISASFLTPQDTPSGYTGSPINSEAQEPLMNDWQDRRYYIHNNNTDPSSLNQVASPFLEIEAETDIVDDDYSSSVDPIREPNVGLQKQKGGRKIYSTPEERKQRNRQAQKAFRDRRTEYIGQLETTCCMLKYENSLLIEILHEKG